MAVYAIGDVQGCCDELQRLLELIRFDPVSDLLWFVGDLVNRGTRSRDTLRLVRSLADRAVTVLGNHDLHLLAVALAPAEKVKSRDTIDDVLDAPDRDELLDWLAHQPMLHFDAKLGRAMLHAGLPPQWDLDLARSCARELESVLRNPQQSRQMFAHMYGNKPDCWSDDLAGFDRLRFITNCFTRLRFCDAQGRIDLYYKGPLSQAPRDLVPWFKMPGRRSARIPIVCGHWSALGYYDSDNVLCIDTGCVWGGSLCAVRLDQPAAPVFVPCSSSGLHVGD